MDPESPRGLSFAADVEEHGGTACKLMSLNKFLTIDAGDSEVTFLAQQSTAIRATAPVVVGPESL